MRKYGNESFTLAFLGSTKDRIWLKINSPKSTSSLCSTLYSSSTIFQLTVPLCAIGMQLGIASLCRITIFMLKVLACKHCIFRSFSKGYRSHHFSHIILALKRAFLNIVSTIKMIDNFSAHQYKFYNRSLLY